MFWLLTFASQFIALVILFMLYGEARYDPESRAKYGVQIWATLFLSAAFDLIALVVRMIA
jgi:hypothetical protein